MDREEARSNKDYDKADQIREQIESLGISIEDSASGTQWKK
jgi:cysteinyl-tRNA synthetase